MTFVFLHQDIVLWLHSIHDQVSAEIEHPFKVSQLRACTV